MKLKFWKMHALGNDFMVAQDFAKLPSPEIIRNWSNRHTGIGFDQLLWIEPLGTHIAIRIYNADGSEAQQCGNGLRCIARYAKDLGLVIDTEFTLATQDAQYPVVIGQDEQVTVNMGAPIFDPEKIPFKADEEGVIYSLNAPCGSFTASVLSMGNPHCVLVDNIRQLNVAVVGPCLSQHPAFPQQVNVGFMQVVNPETINLRVYERGVGETLACGSGACAAVVAGQRQGLLAQNVTVKLPGGTLKVQWKGAQTPVWLTGPAIKVFEGEI